MLLIALPFRHRLITSQDEAETPSTIPMTTRAEAILRRQLELFPGQSLEKTQDGAIPCFSTQMLTNPNRGYFGHKSKSIRRG
jgi:hypothetical protein